MDDVGAANAAGKMYSRGFDTLAATSSMQAGASHLIKHYDELLPLLSTI